MTEYVLNLKEKTFTRLIFLLSNCLHILNILNLCYDRPVRYYSSRFRYMITKLLDRVQWSTYSIRAQFRKEFVAMKNR